MRIAASILSLATLTPLASAVLPNIAGTEWKRTLFTDDFYGARTALPNPNKWQIDIGTAYPGGSQGWGTGEIETSTNSIKNLHLAGTRTGELWIVPIRDANGAWTSARIETKNKGFVAPVGGKLRIEARIRMPAVTATNGLGYWPAFWTLGGAFRGNYQNWPGIGEYDIMENVNALADYNYGIHCGTNPGGVCNEPSGITTRAVCANGNCNGSWHVYTVIVDRSTTPESLSFYVDGRLSGKISETDVGQETWAAATHKGHFVILDVAMGGAYPDALAGGPGSTPSAATVSGREMRVDYVGVWTT